MTLLVAPNDPRHPQLHAAIDIPKSHRNAPHGSSYDSKEYINN